MMSRSYFICVCEGCGSIYVKNCDVVRIIDVAKVIKDKLKSKSKIVNIGLRHGEKIYETLISENEMIRVKKHEDFIRFSKYKKFEL